jgi:hypothetical protein
LLLAASAALAEDFPPIVTCLPIQSISDAQPSRYQSVTLVAILRGLRLSAFDQIDW